MVNPTADKGPDRAFFRPLVHDNPGLLGAIFRFNGSVARMGAARAEAARQGGPRVHDAGEMEKWQGIVNGSNRARAMLSGASDKGFWDFEEESRRLALLDISTLESLILHWGTAFCAPMLNRVVRRVELEDLETKLTPDLLAFARGRGGFCIGELEMPPRDPGTRDLAALVPWYGLRAFRTCSVPWPNALKRIQERRMKDFLAGVSLPGPEPAEDPPGPAYRRAVWFSMKKVLLKEVAPEWTPCFS